MIMDTDEFIRARDSANYVNGVFCPMTNTGESVMLYGAIDSTAYAFQYGERNPTAWRPVLWPIKTLMCLGFLLMLLQSLAELCKDIARIRGEEI